MGLFGSSRKKPRDQFQASVEHQRKRTPAGRSREMQAELSRQYKADLFRQANPFPSQENSQQHPYQRPGFGFYSGENLAAAKSRQRAAKRSVSLDAGVQNVPGGYAGQTMWEEDGFSGNSTPWQDPTGWNDPDVWETAYYGQEAPFGYSASYDFNGPGQYRSLYPLDNSVFGGGRPFSATPFNTPTYPEPPIFDSFRPFNEPRGTNPYAASPLFNSPNRTQGHPIWDGLGGRIGSPFPSSPRRNWPPRPPGSYERLRPPHLRRGSSGAGAGGLSRSSSSRMGEMR
jgi:hypothetical protein